MISRAFRVRYFLSNLLLLLVPLLIPLVVLGTFTIALSETYIKDSLTKNNRNILSQSQQNLGLMLNPLDQVSFLLDTDNGVANFFETLFTSENLDYTEVRTQNLINGFLSSVALSRAFIHSIYVYYPNPEGYFYATGYGRLRLRDQRDKDWLDSWKARPGVRQEWTQVRPLPDFYGTTETRNVISIFHPLGDIPGVVVLNLYPEALRKVWKDLELSPGQEILVFNREGDILLSNRKDHLVSGAELRSLALGGAPRDGDLIASQVKDDRSGWLLLSLTPRTTLYSLPAVLSTVTVGLLLVSLLAGLALTTNLVRRNFNQVEAIATTLESAQGGMPLPPLPQQVGTVYEQITSEILKTFLEQDYLKLQLSEQKARARLLELETHQNQMNPHFLLNTMKTIYWKAFGLTASPNEACAMIDNLSDILGYALWAPTEPVTLEDEVRTARSYLAIQTVRYAGQFQTLWDVPPDSLQVRVPKLLLQPLLENAIYHGIRNSGRKCSILVRVQEVSGALEIVVADTGLGMAPDALADLTRRLTAPSATEGHIGLENTQQRLRLFFGNPWGLSVRSVPSRGTAVRVTLPGRPGPTKAP